MSFGGSNTQKFSVEVDFVAKNQELFDKANKQAKQTADAAKSVKNAYTQYHDELAKLNPDLVKQLDLEKQQAAAMEKTKQATKNLQLEARNMKAQIREANAELRILKDTAQDLDNFVAKPLLLVGGLVTGALFKAATDAVKNSKENVGVVKEWKDAQEGLNQSYQRFGLVVVKEALPLLRQAEEISQKVAAFAEKNPAAVDFALKGGLLALTLGTIAKAVSSGIKLVADIKQDLIAEKQLAAAQLQLQASNNQLEAAGLENEASLAKGYGTTGGLIGPAEAGAASTAGAGLSGTIGTVALTAGSVILGANIGLGIGNFINKLIDPKAADVTWKDIGTEFKQIIAITAEHLGENMSRVSNSANAEAEARQRGLQWFEKTSQALGLLADKANQAGNSLYHSPNYLGGSKENQDKALDDFKKFQDEDNRIVENGEAQRQTIISETESSIAKLTSDYESKRPALFESVNQRAQQLQQGYNDFLTQKAEERADILRGSEDRIKEIRANAQKEREKIEKDFAEASTQAAEDRDALALVKAEKARKEALAQSGSPDEAIRKEKEETARRLQEFDRRFALERAQRFAELQQQLKENAQRLIEFDKQYHEQVAAQKKAEDEKLKALQDSINKERIAKRNQFIAQLNDLGISINNERNLRQQSYNALLVDFQAWLHNMQAAMTGATPTTTTSSPVTTSTGGATGGGTSTYTNPGGFPVFTGGYADGGYAMRPGVATIAEHGYEWVANHNSIRAAENSIAGKVTQSDFVQAMALYGAAKAGLNYTDQSTYNSGMSVRDKRNLQQASREQFDAMLRKVHK